MAPTPILCAHPSSLEHDTGGHPDSIERLSTLLEALALREDLGWRQVRSPEVQREVLERVHSAAHVDRVAALAAAGGGQLDADTVISTGSHHAALHAAGGAVELVRQLVEAGGDGVGFSLHRPPGHHATPSQAMGFCLFNNVAVAAQHALDGLGLERVMILDWDAHHGNGTQDAFWSTDRVLFVSIHQWPLYPGSGRGSELGAGAGRGHTVNLPVPAGAGNRELVSLVRDVAAPLARAYRPQLLLVSAGYDAHRDDPLAGCELTDEGFAAMATIWRELAAELGVPLGCVLEGGYDVSALTRGVLATMSALASTPGSSGGAGGPLAAGPPVGLATDARARLAPLWPALATEDLG